MQLNARWLKWRQRQFLPALGGSLQCDKSSINSANGANLILKLLYHSTCQYSRAPAGDYFEMREGRGDGNGDGVTSNFGHCWWWPNRDREIDNEKQKDTTERH